MAAGVALLEADKVEDDEVGRGRLELVPLDSVDDAAYAGELLDLRAAPFALVILDQHLKQGAGTLLEGEHRLRLADRLELSDALAKRGKRILLLTGHRERVADVEDQAHASPDHPGLGKEAAPRPEAVRRQQPIARARSGDACVPIGRHEVQVLPSAPPKRKGLRVELEGRREIASPPHDLGDAQPRGDSSLISPRIASPALIAPSGSSSSSSMTRTIRGAIVEANVPMPSPAATSMARLSAARKRAQSFSPASSESQSRSLFRPALTGSPPYADITHDARSSGRPSTRSRRASRSAVVFTALVNGSIRNEEKSMEAPAATSWRSRSPSRSDCLVVIARPSSKNSMPYATPAIRRPPNGLDKARSC